MLQIPRAIPVSVLLAAFFYAAQGSAVGSNSVIDPGIASGTLTVNSESIALKHAYADGETGPIMVSLKKASDGSYELRFADRGRGLPSGFNLGETKSLGLKVIMGTARQLGGSVEISRLEKGTEFLIRLPADIGIDTAS